VQTFFLLRERHADLDVSIAYVEGMDFPQQAQRLAAADVLLIPHGAATASLIFLPRQAAVVQVWAAGGGGRAWGGARPCAGGATLSA
jgi:hypothetical protein